MRAGLGRHGRRHPGSGLLAAAVLVGGCFEATPWPPCTIEAGPECFDSASATTGAIGSSSGASGGSIQTVTGATTTTTNEPTTGPATTGTSEGTENAPPVIELFAVQPGHLGEAGQALVQLAASADVVTARLYLDEVEFAALAPAEFPQVYEALSAKDNGDHVFKVVVEDAEGLTATAEAVLTVQLPPAGAQKCLFVDAEAVSSVVAGLVYTDAAIVAVGARDTGAGFKATMWKLDPDHCEVVLPGWPKSIADWTADPALAALPSRASAIAVDEVGNLVIGANLTKDGKPQRYVAFLNPDGARLWEKPGKVGEEVAGVAVAPNTVVAVGWQRTSENPVRTDAMIWQHLEGGGVWAQELKAPFTAGEPFPDKENLRSEWARAVLYDPSSGLIVIAGDRELRTDFNQVSRRSFLARLVPLGGPVGTPWTSPGDVMEQDGTNALGLCGEELLLGGWTRDKAVEAAPQPLTRWVGEDGLPVKKLAEAMPTTQSLGIACDREGKIVHAASRLSGQLDARVFAFADPLGPRTWYEQGNAGDDAAGALACDPCGFCAWGGFRTADGKLVAVVRVHHP